MAPKRRAALDGAGLVLGTSFVMEHRALVASGVVTDFTLTAYVPHTTVAKLCVVPTALAPAPWAAHLARRAARATSRTTSRCEAWMRLTSRWRTSRTWCVRALRRNWWRRRPSPAAGQVLNAFTLSMKELLELQASNASITPGGESAGVRALVTIHVPSFVRVVVRELHVKRLLLGPA